MNQSAIKPVVIIQSLQRTTKNTQEDHLAKAKNRHIHTEQKRLLTNLGLKITSQQKIARSSQKKTRSSQKKQEAAKKSLTHTLKKEKKY